MTSNLGSDKIQDRFENAKNESKDRITQKAKEDVNGGFKKHHSTRVFKSN